MMSTIKRIAVLTSGADAPGMNGAVRAVVRMGREQRWEVYGVRHGFRGLMEDSFQKLESRSVSRILQLGGTFLGTTRDPKFKTEEGRQNALRNLQRLDIDAVVVIGGAGSQAGAYELSKMGMRVVGIAASVNNDIPGSDMTIGADTALNIALESIDRLKTTAASTDRAFLVEVMGRDCGYLALMAGIAGGAEVVVVPEFDTEPHAVATELWEAYQRLKSHALAIVSEGAKYNAASIAKHFAEHRDLIGFDLRVTTLGHVQRGGAPTAFDRLLSSRLGAAAVECLARGEHGVTVGWHDGKPVAIPFDKIVGLKKVLDESMYALAKVLAK